MSNTHEFTLGLDLAQASFTAAIAAEGVDPKAWRTLPNTALAYAPDSPEALAALKAWLAKTAPGGRCARVIVESTGSLSRRVAYGLHQCGWAVSIINPRRSKALGDSLGVRDKTDAVDCVVLALYGALYRPAPTRLRAAAHEEMCELVRLRAAMVRERTAWLGRLSQAGAGGGARRAIEKTIAHLERQIGALECQIDRQLEADEQLRRQVAALDTIAGIGPVTARTLTAELGDLRCYSRNQLVALAGLFPKRFESGQSVARRPRLAKGGGGRLRRVLYMCATSLFTTGGVWRAWIERQRARGLEDMCIIGMLMRKLLLVCRAVMIAGGRYQESMIGLGEAQYEKKLA